ncbi:hypothetical protein FH609_006885 [Streptomyces sp. 3MP-14]|uniref:Uncharacterized protein n=1 Tax=Streptomyces mimosae TaxID=2586635 RepID=A0A5N6AJG0_9ACTN|nr:MULTISPECIES: hypothetical protein [Streptomyces]KAB8168861.1 hypothetical protein FH607_006480 [Streptomyces mimosae]KAB8177859.1 hypothetical protein FH609_006885 [Streptomyces sp. 3MP-14]
MTRGQSIPVALTAGALTLALVSCGGDDGDNSDETREVLQYSVANEELDAGRVDLLMDDAGPPHAMAAIGHYAAGLDASTDVIITVYRDEGLSVVICEAAWPDFKTNINCPDETNNEIDGSINDDIDGSINSG